MCCPSKRSRARESRRHRPSDRQESYLGYLLSVLLGAMIIKNFVFTKYLGLCVFFGTSQKKSTAVAWE